MLFFSHLWCVPAQVREITLQARQKQSHFIRSQPSTSRTHEHDQARTAEAMGVVSAVADAVVVLFSLTIAVGVPLIDAQAVLSHDAYPAQLRDLKRWYAAEFDDYLMAHPPPFFRGLLCLELAFLWPLSVATVYGVLARRRWAATTSLMVGVTTLTSLSAIFGEMLGSGKATTKLLQMYVPYAVFAVIAILRGLCSCSAPASPASSARKKRV
ncbi:sigma intracellular receptor 2-like [Triticum dicoccoides]|nr:sigma intracellular receptor 2-like [Triticum dicoccoides]XP_044390905.1 sigma intracellular receptor 2-like [Triticum aestivum]